MTIELDSTLAQAEVLFLSFAQLMADIDRRQAEEAYSSPSQTGLRNRGSNEVQLPELSSNLRELLQAGRA